MKKFILEKEDDCILVKDFNATDRIFNQTIVATLVPDSSTDNKIFFLVGNTSHRFYFTNLCGQSLGSHEYDTAQEVIQKRIQGCDCNCNRTEVYLFKNIEEVMRKLGG